MESFWLRQATEPMQKANRSAGHSEVQLQTMAVLQLSWSYDLSLYLMCTVTCGSNRSPCYRNVRRQLNGRSSNNDDILLTV